MIITLAQLQVQPAEEEAFLAAAKLLTSASQQEEGNVSYSLKKDIGQENTFTMVELWTGMDAVQRHNESDHFKAFVEKAPAFLGAPLSVQMFQGEELK
ncbi:putative quinol monooxygenase [Jeotgalibacillus salarius]|uniref:Antibiotic biosynthesis monooxygenase n=1 Tax=Jeotgalibacillus salarius TaxID=546023 RepID=A0A4Y8LHK3_9BACL|nr:putative quinol monooxygenase [Jeotgalibacillus salarius]TFE02300.1 antibiotic biosynthesis monooxygenase [Jeotgalibacillus salarius]